MPTCSILCPVLATSLIPWKKFLVGTFVIKCRAACHDPALMLFRPFLDLVHMEKIIVLLAVITSYLTSSELSSLPTYRSQHAGAIPSVHNMLCRFASFSGTLAVVDLCCVS